MGFVSVHVTDVQGLGSGSWMGGGAKAASVNFEVTDGTRKYPGGTATSKSGGSTQKFDHTFHSALNEFENGP